jgi:hypothetical protein
MKVGTRVRMKESLKKLLIENESRDHVEEFGDEIGVVIPKEAAIEQWPEVEVLWGDTGLHYLYHPDQLEEVE